MSKLPTIQDYRTALAALIVQKDQLNAAATHYIQQVDLAAQTLEQMLQRAEEELVSEKDAD